MVFYFLYNFFKRSVCMEKFIPFEKLSKKRRLSKICKETFLNIESIIEENALLGALANNPALYSLKYNFGWTDKPQRSSDEESKSIKISLDGECDKWAS